MTYKMREKDGTSLREGERASVVDTLQWHVNNLAASHTVWPPFEAPDLQELLRDPDDLKTMIDLDQRYPILFRTDYNFVVDGVPTPWGQRQISVRDRRDSNERHPPVFAFRGPASLVHSGCAAHPENTRKLVTWCGEQTRLDMIKFLTEIILRPLQRDLRTSGQMVYFLDDKVIALIDYVTVRERMMNAALQRGRSVIPEHMNNPVYLKNVQWALGFVALGSLAGGVSVTPDLQIEVTLPETHIGFGPFTHDATTFMYDWGASTV